MREAPSMVTTASRQGQAHREIIRHQRQVCRVPGDLEGMEIVSSIVIDHA